MKEEDGSKGYYKTLWDFQALAGDTKNDKGQTGLSGRGRGRGPGGGNRKGDDEL